MEEHLPSSQAWEELCKEGAKKSKTPLFMINYFISNNKNKKRYRSSNFTDKPTIWDYWFRKEVIPIDSLEKYIHEDSAYLFLNGIIVNQVLKSSVMEGTFSPVYSQTVRGEMNGNSIELCLRTKDKKFAERFAEYANNSDLYVIGEFDKGAKNIRVVNYGMAL